MFLTIPSHLPLYVNNNIFILKFFKDSKIFLRRAASYYFVSFFTVLFSPLLFVKFSEQHCSQTHSFLAWGCTTCYLTTIVNASMMQHFILLSLSRCTDHALSTSVLCLPHKVTTALTFSQKSWSDSNFFIFFMRAGVSFYLCPLLGSTQTNR